MLKVPLVGAILLSLVPGCGSEVPMTPVKGRVTYNDEPLTFGVVMFHPPRGQVAQALIESDGTFNLSTFRKEDGVVPGNYRVSVLCFEAHDPGGSGPREDEGGGMWLGKSLIPLKYTRASSSGLSTNISLEDPQEILIELKGTSR